MSQDNLFVEVADTRHIGKLMDGSVDPAPVEFFNSIKDRQTSLFAAPAWKRTYLARQTRVYFSLDHGDRWGMGRVIDYRMEDDGSVIYDVKAPNNIEYSLSERDLFTRSYGSAGDPADVLALGAAEAQLWHDARWSARVALTRLRAAACGLEGLVAGSVELAPHQAAAVRRVSQDPLQRYLLADEVGLGKTIEAGGLIAQCLLDNPSATVAVLAPPSLVGQWRRELASKFGLGDDHRVRVVSHDQAATVLTPHLLVVDEAHACAAGRPHDACIGQLATEAERLLLLTATPLVGSEAAFLQLLRWLDPNRWLSETPESFSVHVARSQDYGRLLLGLRPDAPAFVLKQRVTAARAAFTGDAAVEEMADRFSETDDPAARAAICAALRDHIADAYRIHHRLLRARRSDLDGWEFRARAGAAVREEGDDEDDTEEALAILEDWRRAAFNAAQANPAIAPTVSARFIGLLETFGRGLAALGSVEASEEQFPGELELIEGLRAVGHRADPAARVRFTAEVVARQITTSLRANEDRVKIVVFTSDDATALIQALTAALSEEHRVYGVGETEAFQQATAASVIALGRDGEEGLNLHFADVIVHADLPLDVGRMEQRIGRLDRFGRTKGPIRHLIITPSGDDETPWSTWLHWLRYGLGIFDRSASDIQFVLEAVEADLADALLTGTSTEDEASTTSLAERIAAERQKLDEQYALDQLSLAPESARELIEIIEDGEADEAALADEVGGLLRLLQFGGHMTADTFRLSWARDTLIPEIPWRPVFESALRKPLTWRRRIAQSNPEVALLRPGSALIEALDRFLEWDDRGTAFATWRARPGFGGPGEERVALKLCWQVTPRDLAGSGLQASAEMASLRRQARTALPPWTLVQFLDLSLNTIEDPALLEVLAEAYRKEAIDSGGRDYNLGSRQSWLWSVIDPSVFSLVCGAVREEGRARVAASDLYRQRIEVAEESVVRAEERRKRREAVSGGTGGSPPEGRFEDLLDSVRNPDIRLESIGVFVVSGTTPRNLRP